MDKKKETIENKSLKELFEEYYSRENGGAKPDEEFIDLPSELSEDRKEESSDSWKGEE